MPPYEVAQSPRRLATTSDQSASDQVRRRSGLPRNPVHKFYKSRDPKAFVETASHLRPVDVDGGSTERSRLDDDEASTTQRSPQLLRGGGDGVR
jgi:hypothetical protein